jgi:hypothetical protein
MFFILKKWLYNAANNLVIYKINRFYESSLYNTHDAYTQNSNEKIILSRILPNLIQFSYVLKKNKEKHVWHMW